MVLHYDAPFSFRKLKPEEWWFAEDHLLSWCQSPASSSRSKATFPVSEASCSTWWLQSWHCTSSNFYLKNKSIRANLPIPVWSQAKSQLSTIYEIVAGALETELLYLFSLRWSLSPDNCKGEWTYSSKVSFTVSSLASSVHSSCLLTATELHTEALCWGMSLRGRMKWCLSQRIYRKGCFSHGG